MLTQVDFQMLIKYISDNYIICQYKNGYSTFTELLLKNDVIADCYFNPYKEQKL